MQMEKMGPNSRKCSLDDVKELAKDKEKEQSMNIIRSIQIMEAFRRLK